MENVAYTADEKCVIGHFFTDTESPIYAATDAMPSQLWAFLVGGASRSNDGVRGRFLKMFREQVSTDAEYETLIHNIAEAIRSESALGTSGMLAALDKATKFMSKWAVQYGHNSLKDSAQDRLIADYISIRGAKILEESHLCGVQERSTRYVDFRTLGFICPPLFKNNAGTVMLRREESEDFNEAIYVTEATALHAKCIATYTEILDAAIAHYRETLNPANFVSVTAFENTARAKAFDTARYALLTCLPTALGITAPTREIERRLSSWLSSPHDEVVRIAEQLHKACLVNNAGLLRHVKPSDSEHAQLSQAIVSNCFHGISETVKMWTPATAPESGVGSYDSDSIKHSVSLMCPVSYGDNGFLYDLAASILKRGVGTNIPTHIITDHLIETGNVEGAWNAIIDRLSHRKPHEELPEEFAVGEFTCAIEIDYGAFRDLQRHRNGTLVCSDLDCSFGFMVPELLTQPKFAALHTSYCEYMEAVAAFHARVRSYNPAVAEYWFALGHKVQFDYHCDFRQLIYICELRSQAAGHYSYRLVAQELFRQLAHGCFADFEDAFKSLFNVDMSDPFAGSRADSENRAEAKLAALRKSENTTKTQGE